MSYLPGLDPTSFSFSNTPSAGLVGSKRKRATQLVDFLGANFERAQWDSTDWPGNLSTHY